MLTILGVDNFNDFYDPRLKYQNLRQARQHEKFTLEQVDICDNDSLGSVFEKFGPEVVVHLAARAGVRPSLENPNMYNATNVIGSQNVLDACLSVPLSHIVFASSSSVYGGLTTVPFTESMAVDRPISPYAATKKMNELMGHVYSATHGLKITFLRFFTVYGPRQRPDMAISKFTRLIQERKPIPMFGDGSTKRDYTYIDDVLSGILAAIDKPFDYEIMNIGESRTIELRDLIELIGNALDIRPIIEQKPTQPGDVEITYADVSKAQSLLDYNPGISTKEGIERYVEWFKQSLERSS